MSLYKRGNTWWVRFTTPSGQQIRRSAKTADRYQAQEFHDRLKTEFWRINQLGERPRRKWEDAVERWVLEQTGKKVTLDDDLFHLRWVHPYLFGKYLDEIKRDVLDLICQEKLKTGVANATVNRMLEVVRAILRRCEREWDWLIKAPFVRLLPLPARRIRWLTHAEADRLLEELPEHLAEMARFSLATGLREANVVKLEWSQVDLSRRCAWIHPDQAKARRAIAVPLNAEAIRVLRRQMGKHKERVFLYKGKPVNKAGTRAWRTSLKQAGIKDFRWHDLRHTWASWHIQLGTPVHVLQELGGWSDIRMVMRYAHLSSDHLAPYAEKLSRPHAISTNAAQSSWGR